MDKYFTHDELVYAIKKAVMDEKRRIVDEMEAIREKFRHDLTGVDKYTLDRIRKLVADYYNAESRMLEFTETCIGKVNTEFALRMAELTRLMYPEPADSIDLSAYATDGKIVEKYPDGTTKVITMEFDAYGNPIKITDGDGRVTILTW